MAYAIILFSGESRRFNGSKPKQFVEINNKPLFMYSVERFANNRNIDGLVLVTNEEMIDEVKDIAKAISKPLFVIKGGSTRSESSYNGLMKVYEVSGNKQEKVLIHDGARPLVNDEMIDSLIDALNECESCTIAGKCTSTMMDESGNYIDRSKLNVIGTPQGFKLETILKAHEKCQNSMTDDTSLVAELGIKPKIIINDSPNIKVTTQEDLVVVKAILESR